MGNVMVVAEEVRRGASLVGIWIREDIVGGGYCTVYVYGVDGRTMAFNSRDM